MSDDQTLQLILTVAVTLLILEQLIIGFAIWGVVKRVKGLIRSAEEVIAAGKETLRESQLPKPFRVGAAVWNMWKRKSAKSK